MELARLFARQGHRIYLAESVRFPLTRFSNSIFRYIHVPQARFRPHDYANALCDIIVREKIDICIPNLEEIFYIAACLTRFPSSCVIWADTFEKLDLLHNKWTFIECIKNMGFEVPRTEHASSREELLSRWMTFPFPKAVVKPVYSRFASQTIILNRGDRLPASVQPTKSQPWIVQEFISGRHLCTYSVTRKDKVLANSIYPSRQQLGIGSSTVFEHVDSPGARRWVERFVSKMQFTGQIGFDFIETNDGTLYPIECNPRATSGIHLFRNTPEFAQIFFGDQVNGVVIPSGDEVRSVKFWLAVRLMRLMLDKRPLQEWRETWRYIRASKDVFYERGDPWPIAGHVFGLAEVLIQSARFGVSPREIATRGCDYNGVDESTSRQISRHG